MKNVAQQQKTCFLGKELDPAVRQIARQLYQSNEARGQREPEVPFLLDSITGSPGNDLHFLLLYGAYEQALAYRKRE